MLLLLAKQVATARVKVRLLACARVLRVLVLLLIWVMVTIANGILIIMGGEWMLLLVGGA